MSYVGRGKFVWIFIITPFGLPHSNRSLKTPTRMTSTRSSSDGTFYAVRSDRVVRRRLSRPSLNTCFLGNPSRILKRSKQMFFIPIFSFRRKPITKCLFTGLCGAVYTNENVRETFGNTRQFSRPTYSTCTICYRFPPRNRPRRLGST